MQETSNWDQTPPNFTQDILFNRSAILNVGVFVFCMCIYVLLGVFCVIK